MSAVCDKDMVFTLHVARDISSLLEEMRLSGKKGALAVRQCEAILAAIRCHGHRHPAVLGKRTRYGELRLKNCVKYDLGHGYRLVTVRSGEDLYILYAGSHDKTDQWIELRRRSSSLWESTSFQSERIVIENTDVDASGSEWADEACLSDDSYELAIASRLDDATLQAVFCGLVQVRHQQR